MYGKFDSCVEHALECSASYPLVCNLTNSTRDLNVASAALVPRIDIDLMVTPDGWDDM